MFLKVPKLVSPITYHVGDWGLGSCDLLAVFPGRSGIMEGACLPLLPLTRS